MPNKITAWFPVTGLALAAFIFVTSELMPVGLLPDISADINRPESTTGLLVTGYAWIVALISLPLTLATVAVNRRPLLLVLLLIFSLGNFMSGFTGSFGAMFSTRVAVAFAHALFWSITTPLAARLAPYGKYTYGLAAVSAGTTMATVLGVPLGTFLGHKFGWRLSFQLISGAGLFIASALFFLLPSLPSKNAGSLKSIPALVRNKPLIAAYIVTACIITGDFTAYTYLVPYLENVVSTSHDTVVAVLLVYGFSGVAGIFIASKYMDRYMRQILILFASFVFIALFMLYFMRGSLPLTVGAMLIWSISLAAVGLSFQSWILRLAPDAADAAISVYSGIYNVGIGLGAMMGGITLDRLGTEYIGFTGAAFVIPAVILIAVFARNFNRLQSEKA